MQRLVVASLFVCGTASAGPLGKVVGGLHSASGSGSSSGTSSGGSRQHHDPPCCASSPSGYVTTPTPYYVEDRAIPQYRLVKPDIHAYFGVQSVADSGGSFSGELRISHGMLGIAGHVSSFFEEPEMGGTLTTRLDLYGVGPVLRVVNDGPSELWIEASFAGIHTVPTLNMYGGAAGLTFRHRLGGAVAVSSIARWYLLQHDVRALELKAAVNLSILQIGYRILDFNVGPPLHGPEIGLSATF